MFDGPHRFSWCYGSNSAHNERVILTTLLFFCDGDAVIWKLVSAAEYTQNSEIKAHSSRLFPAVVSLHLAITAVFCLSVLSFSSELSLQLAILTFLRNLNLRHNFDFAWSLHLAVLHFFSPQFLVYIWQFL